MMKSPIENQEKSTIDVDNSSTDCSNIFICNNLDGIKVKTVNTLCSDKCDILSIEETPTKVEIKIPENGQCHSKNSNVFICKNNGGININILDDTYVKIFLKCSICIEGRAICTTNNFLILRDNNKRTIFINKDKICYYTCYKC